MLRPNTVKNMLKKLVKEGCGHGGWCNCLICRVQRVAQTESTRTEENSWDDPSKKTKMIDWRGGAIEFGKGNNDSITQPPWYGIKMSGFVWHDHAWFYWLDYKGPPMLYLTRIAAEKKAKALRKQYRPRKGDNLPRVKVEVVKVGEL